jgi:hypothetical protein
MKKGGKTQMGRTGENWKGNNASPKSNEALENSWAAIKQVPWRRKLKGLYFVPYRLSKHNQPRKIKSWHTNRLHYSVSRAGEMFRTK